MITKGKTPTLTHSIRPVTGVMLAKKYSNQDPTQWYMSEKLDGVRAVWDGENFISRNNTIFHAPRWFVETMPQGVMLDGELWEDRGAFQTTVGKVRAKEGDWSQIKFMVFDVINDALFEERQQHLATLSPRLPQHCQLVSQRICTGRDDMLAFENEIKSLKGEGIMLRAPHSPYEPKRSNYLLKVKQFKDDEAIVVGYDQGKGRNEGVVGALICEWQGKTFNVGAGLSDELRANPPKVGATITFQYFETTLAGVPRHPSFVSVRDYEGEPQKKPKQRVIRRFTLSSTHHGENRPDSNWPVEPTTDYRQACANGRQMGARFVQQLKDSPDYVGTGLLGHVAGDIDFQDATETKGHWIGFFSYLERHLYDSAIRHDIAADIAMVQAEWAAIASRRDRIEQWEN